MIKHKTYSFIIIIIIIDFSQETRVTQKASAGYNRCSPIKMITYIFTVQNKYNTIQH